MNNGEKTVGYFTSHDLKVFLVHVVLIFIQSGLIALGKEDFGTYTAVIALLIQFLLAEVGRRLLV